MSVRSLVRQAVIRATTALGADGANRASERLRACLQRQPPVRVLFFHSTPAEHADRFRRQLDWLQQRFDILDFDAFSRAFESLAPGRSRRPAALLTFDDGFVSNYTVAAPALEAAGLRGLFFVVPAFSEAIGSASRRFYAERFPRRRAPYERAMTPDEIGELASRGHTLGNHTFSHVRLSTIPEAEYAHEVVDAAALIESWTGRSVEAFAWPFTWDAITPAVHRIAATRHQYCFAPCAGMVDPLADPASLLWRTNAEIDRSFEEFRFQCSGLADYPSAPRRRRLRRLLDGTDHAADSAAP